MEGHLLRNPFSESFRQAQSNPLLDAVMDSIADGILAVDSNGKVILYNSNFARLWKIPVSLIELKDDKKLLDFISDQLTDKKQFLKKVGYLYKHPSLKSSDIIGFKDGRSFYRYSQPLISGEKIIGRIWNFRDVTEKKRAASKIKESELKYRRLFETAQDGILIIDADSGSIIDVNPFLMNILAYTNNEFIGKKLWEISPFRDVIANKNKFDKLRREKYVRYENLPLETKSGKKVYVEFVSNLYLVDKKRIIQCNIRDISDRKKAEEEIKKFKYIIENTFEAIAIMGIDKKHLLKYVNPAWEKLFGYKSREVLNKKEALIIEASKQNPELRKSLLEAFNAGRMFDAEMEWKTKSGNRVQVEAVAMPVKAEGRVVNWFNTARDISERKRAEEIALQSDQLKNFEMIDRAKTDFLNIVSHELKTPLTAIFANLELLEDVKEKIPKENVNNLDALKRNSDQLKMIIDNILEISRLQSNKFELNIEEIDLKKKIMSVADGMKILAERKNIDLLIELGELPRLKTDGNRVAEILNNLLDNAIKFTEKGFVKLKAEKQENLIVISVKDTGIGIPLNKQRGIFQQFYQADSSIKRAYGGSGLGLSIVKKMVEALGGKVGFKSEAEKGSTFFFTLPLKIEGAIGGKK